MEFGNQNSGKKSIVGLAKESAQKLKRPASARRPEVTHRAGSGSMKQSSQKKPQGRPPIRVSANAMIITEKSEKSFGNLS